MERYKPHVFDIQDISMNMILDDLVEVRTSEPAVTVHKDGKQTQFIEETDAPVTQKKLKELNETRIPTTATDFKLREFWWKRSSFDPRKAK